MDILMVSLQNIIDRNNKKSSLRKSYKMNAKMISKKNSFYNKSPLIQEKGGEPIRSEINCVRHAEK